MVSFLQEMWTRLVNVGVSGQQIWSIQAIDLSGGSAYSSYGGKVIMSTRKKLWLSSKVCSSCLCAGLESTQKSKVKEKISEIET